MLLKSLLVPAVFALSTVCFCSSNNNDRAQEDSNVSANDDEVLKLLLLTASNFRNFINNATASVFEQIIRESQKPQNSTLEMKIAELLNEAEFDLERLSKEIFKYV
jgi:hypothetical protein